MHQIIGSATTVLCFHLYLTDK